MSRFVLFGAGASTYSCYCGADRPPLGPDLFERLIAAHPEIRDCLNDRAWEAFSTGRPFEEGMDLAWEIGSRTVAPFLRIMAKYLSAFEPCDCGRNAYRQLLRGVSNRLTRVRFATLNYDIMLDRIAREPGWTITYGTRNLPGTSQNNLTLLKPHGASNLLPNLGSNVVTGSDIRDVEVYFEGLEVEATLSSARIRQWCDNPQNEDLAPVMSVYAAGKRTPINGGWALDQRRQLGDLFRHADRVVVIGVKLVEADDHIWGALSQCRGAITYVNPSTEDQHLFQEWSRRCRRNLPAESVEQGFLEGVALVLRRLTA